MGTTKSDEFPKDLATAESLKIQSPAVLNIDSIQFRKSGETTGSNALKVTEGQAFEVLVTVSNTGEADAINIQATLTPTIEGKATVVSTPSAVATIPGGGSHEFIWEYTTTVGSNASLKFIAEVNGKDKNSGKPVLDKDTSDYLYIQTGIIIIATIYIGTDSKLTKDNFTEGQETIYVVMEVENLGQATAVNVTPTIRLTSDSTGTANYTGPELPPGDILGGGRLSFSWPYNPTGEGYIQFEGSAKGSDANDPTKEKESPLATSNRSTIQTPAVLSVEAVKIIPESKTASEGQDISIEIKIANSGQASATGVTVILSRRVSENTSNAPLPTFSKQDIPGNQPLPLPFTSASYTTKEGDAGIFALSATINGFDGNSQKPITQITRTIDPITIQTIPHPVISDFNVTKVDAPTKKDIGIDQEFKVSFTVENTGEATAMISPSDKDLSISPQEYYFITIPDPLEVPNTLTYRIRTIQGKTPSGVITLTIGDLKITDKNTGKQVDFTKPAGKEIKTDMEKPKLVSVTFIDTVENAIVEPGEMLRLEFNEEIESADANASDFLLPLANDTLGEGSKVSVDASNPKFLIITLGQNPKIDPEGQYGEPDASGIGMHVQNQHITDHAGNVPDDQSILDIDIDDSIPPNIVNLSLNNEATSAKPILYLRVKDESKGFDSGIDINAFEFMLDGSSVNVNMKETNEFLAKGTVMAAPSKLKESDLTLEVTFKQPLSEGKHTLTVIAKDKKGNPSQPKTITFNTVPESGTLKIIDLATYPNPAQLQLESTKINIRYVLSSEAPNVVINIYDVSGWLVRRFKTSGKMDVNTIEWDGSTESANKESVAAGIYICELIVEDQHKYWRIAIRP